MASRALRTCRATLVAGSGTVSLRFEQENKREGAAGNDIRINGIGKR
jgi:hypothetical protein